MKDEKRKDYLMGFPIQQLVSLGGMLVLIGISYGTLKAADINIQEKIENINTQKDKDVARIEKRLDKIEGKIDKVYDILVKGVNTN